MAKINFTNQQNQENPLVVVTLASIGVLMCMVVTVLGIKLWWFKHRLSFEQTSTQNGAAGGNPPMVVVPSRNKKRKFNKDKRLSQQIYDNVEVHGVFRQKQEDDMDIQRPQRLPPVRIRQLSESTQSLILPPPRNKRRQQQVHSTGFEDMEIATPLTLSPAPSSSILTTTNDTRFSLTFEEFEKQFQLKEIKPEIPETPLTNEIVSEIPVPALRINRSSSAMVQTEKTQRFLKSSQSITMPEFHKVIERRPTGFSRPTEDLTKIDVYEQSKLFESFGERRPTGYIKYDEVDRDFNEQYEQELNQREEINTKRNLFDYKFTANGNWESTKDLQAMKNEGIINQNDLQESPDVLVAKRDNLTTDTFERSLKENDFLSREEYKDNLEISERPLEHAQSLDKQFKDMLNHKESIKTLDNTEINPLGYEDSQSTQNPRQTGYVSNEELLLAKQDEGIDYKPVEGRRPTEFVRDLPQEITHDFVEYIEASSIKDDFDNQFLDWPQFEEKLETPKVNIRKFENHDFETQISVEEPEELINTIEKPAVTFDLPESKNVNKENFEKCSLKLRRPTGYNRNWMEENNDPEDLSETENLEKDFKEKSFSKQKIFYGQLRTLMTEESVEFQGKPEVKFELSEMQDSEYEDLENFTIKQKIPMGFVKEEREDKKEEHERSVTFNLTKDKEFVRDEEKSSVNQRRPTGYVRNCNKGNGEDEVETQQHKVKFENSNWLEDDYENYSLNQRRPTGFRKNQGKSVDSDEDQEIVINELKDSENILDPQSVTKVMQGTQKGATGYNKSMEYSRSNERIFSKDSLKTQVTFARSTDFEHDKKFWDSDIKQRRPTGYIKKSALAESSDEEETDLKVSFEESTNFKESEIENSFIKQRRAIKNSAGTNNESTEISNDVLKLKKDNTETMKIPSVRFKELEYIENDLENYNDSAIKQRRPTGFVRTTEVEELFGSTKPVNFNLNNSPDEEDKNNHEKSEALKSGRSTDYVRKPKIESLENLEIITTADAFHTPISWLSNEMKSNEVDSLWQELENGLDGDYTQNIEEEFAKIRHSYELNEGDFLELRNELSPPVNIQVKPFGFGKCIEDDWENFEKLNMAKIQKLKEDQQEIQIICNEQELSTSSILKETKIIAENQDILKDPEEIKPQPRKSKVTFDFKTEEHIIPGRNTELDSEEEDYYEDNSDYDDSDAVYGKSPLPVPPQPMQRLSQSKSSSSAFTPVVAIPTSISLFGSQISQEDVESEDSWSAIRKHRFLTEEFQNLSLDSKHSTPASAPPPKPAYRNPMAQLAIQRAKEVRTEMDGFKSRSINDVKRHAEASKRNQQNKLNLHNDDFNDTEA